MARKKRSQLPQVPARLRARGGSSVRRTPNGGWAWTCHYCGQYASSETLAGRYVCRRHGGVTPRQRDPYLRELAFEATGRRPRPPGRPIVHGLRSRGPTVRVIEYLRSRRAQAQRDVDALRRRIAKWT